MPLYYYKEGPGKVDGPIGSVGARQMSLCPEAIEMIRKYCDVGQIETAKLYANRDFFWKDAKTMIDYNPEKAVYHLQVNPMKTSHRMVFMQSTLEDPYWREKLKKSLSLHYGNPWDSEYYEDPRRRRR